MKKIILIVALLMATTCFAQTGGGGTSENNVGKVRKIYKVDKFFAEVNKSKTGKITKEEWVGAGLKEMLFSFVDLKNQGYIDIEELKVAVFPIEIDIDKTGELTVKKILAYEKKNMPSGGGAPGGSGGPQQK